MNTPIENLSPQDYERQVLPTLIEKAKEYDAHVKAFLDQGHTRRIPSAELNAFGQQLKQWESYFRNFEPAAQTLAQANLPKMRQWLDWAIKDMPDLQITIANWAEQAARHEGAMTGILQKSNQDMLQVMKDVHNQQQESFKKANDLWSNYLKR